MSARELKSRLRAMIPDSAEVELDPNERITHQDVQRQRYLEKFKQVSVDVRGVTQRVLRMCGNLRQKGEKGQRRGNSRNDARALGAWGGPSSGDYQDHAGDPRVGLYSRSGLAGGLREGP